MKLLKLQENLQKLGYSVHTFATKELACEYVSNLYEGKTIGIGGSITIEQMGLYEKLNTRNTVYWHLRSTPEDVLQTRQNAVRAQIYLSSVNGISLNGEIVNIDNTGNRVAAATFGCEQVVFLISKNKIAPSLEEAIFRAQNIAAPKNAKRLGLKTPCAERADKCYQCNSPQRICRNLSIFLKKPTGCHYEIVLIDEELGY